MTPPDLAPNDMVAIAVAGILLFLAMCAAIVCGKAR